MKVLELELILNEIYGDYNTSENSRIQALLTPLSNSLFQINISNRNYKSVDDNSWWDLENSFTNEGGYQATENDCDVTDAIGLLELQVSDHFST